MTVGTLAAPPASTTPAWSDPYTLRIPAPAVWLSANDRRDPRRAASDIKSWREAGCVYARQAHLPRGLTAVHVIARCHRTIKRRSDVGNLYPTAKAVVDGLVDAGLVADDDNRHVLGPDMRPGRVVSLKDYPGGGLMVLTIHPLMALLDPEVAP